MTENELSGSFLWNNDDDWFGSHTAEETAATANEPSTPKYLEPHPVAPDEPCWDTWSDDPFDRILVPFGALLEPEGYAAMRAMGQRRTDSYAVRMPRTYAVAKAIYGSVIVPEVWGQHIRPKKGFAKKDEHGRSLLDVTWLTHTAGKWIDHKRSKKAKQDAEVEAQQGVTKESDKKKGDGHPQSPMVLLDIIKTLADPDCHAVGNKDVWGWHRRHRMVRCVRIDIDLDRVFDGHDLASLRGEIKIVHSVFNVFGLSASIMRTGNRGIQAMATIPDMPRAHAGLLVHAIRHALKNAPRRWLATDFQSNLDGIMRLPLGRHAWTQSISAMLAPDASILPLKDQAEAAVSGLSRPTTMDSDWVDDIGGFFASRDIYPWSSVPEVILDDFAREQPENDLIRLLDDACLCVGADQFAGKRSKMQPIPDIELSLLSPKCPAAHDHAIENERPEQPSTSKQRIPVNKTRAWCILNTGFEPGASFGYYMNLTVNGVKGRNAIGMALIAHDGDVEAARAWLHQQAIATGNPTQAVIKDRLGLINRCLKLDSDGNPRNTTYTTLQRFLARLQATQPYRTLDGDVLPEEIVLANQVVDLMVERQRGSSIKPRVFTDKALEIIRQTVGLLLMEMRQSDDGLAHVSFRSLASRMSGIDNISAVDVSRQMDWIVAGPKCLVECFLVIPGASRYAFSPISYCLGDELNSLIPLISQEQE